MHKLLLTLFMIGLTSPAKTPPNKDTFDPVVVLELFTSQGCSSCPPADELLDQVKQSYASDNVVVLSYHVDYWNYIGWKDPFSKLEFTNRQRAYGQKFSSSSIYTPQVVVNGMEHFVGSRSREMNTKIKSYLKRPARHNVALHEVKRNHNTVQFKYDVTGGIEDTNIRFALVIEHRETYVSRGENRKRTLNNSNIVISENLYRLEAASGHTSIEIPKIVKSEDALRLIVITQTKDLSITGADQVKL